MKTTRNRRNTCKRVLAMLTALAMSFSMLQSVAFADDLTGGGENEPAVIADTEPNTNDPSDSTGGNDTTNESGDSQTPPADGETPQEPADEVVPPFPADKSLEEQQAWYDKYTKRPGQSDEVGTTTGDPTDVPKKDEGEEPPETSTEDPNWKVFWNPDTKSYELTYEIDEDAKEFEQTIDLTKALELLNKYAQDAEKPTAPAGSEVSDEAMAEYESQKEEYDGFLDYLCKTYNMFNSPSEDSGIAEGILAEEGMEGFCDKVGGMFRLSDEDIEFLMNPPQEPKPDVDTDSPEYQAYLKELEEYNRQLNANLLQPGDIRKFTIFLTSKSGHTYKYKDGSFTLATPNLGETEGVKGFDGQYIPEGDNGHTHVEHTYTVSGGLKPLYELMTGAGVQPWEIKAPHSSFEELLNTVANSAANGGDAAVQAIADTLGVGYTRTEADKGYDRISYEFTDLSSAVKDYLVKYYSEKDGRTYTDLDDVFAKSINARADMVHTDNSAAHLENMKFDGEIIKATYGNTSDGENDFTYNHFYQSLLSFLYGDAEDVEKMLSDVTGIQPDSKHPEFDNINWSSNLKELGLDYSVVLEQYMSHQKAWKEADLYFQDLLKDGLSVKDAVGKAFTMAINIDGGLTSNPWQTTKWGWYNSIKLERTDYDFELVKTDENGEPIESNATAFQLWYVNGDGEKVYFTQNENGEFVETTDSNAVVKTNEEGKLSSLYTLMKDKIYYLQEAEAPDGYVIDPTVYVLTDSADKIDEEKLQAEANAKKEALEKDLNTLLESAPDYAASSEKFQELKEKIDAYLAADGKTGTDTAAYADELQAQLNALKANDMSIGELSAALGSTKDQVQADIDAFEAKREELSNLYNSASSRIDALNSSLQAEYDAFNAVKARYEASTDPAERAALRDQMTASQLEAQRLTAEMSAVKSAYDSSSLHTEYAALQAAAQGSLSSYNGYKSALDSITSTQEYQDLKERLETLQALKDAKAEMDGHASAAEIAELNKQIALAENQTFKLIADLTESKNADWLKNLSLSVSFKNQKEIEEKDFEVLLPDEFGSLSMSGSFNSPLPDGMEFTFDVPDPDPTPDPDPDPTPDPDPDPDPTPDPDPDPDPTPIPDPPVPLTPTPDTTNSQLPPPNAPSTPDVPDTTPIPDVDVPLADAPEVEEPVEELVEIPEEEVPLGNPDVPKTGDISGVWYTMTLLAAAGLVFITILERKKQKAAQEN